jgi:hypothetical protein
MLVSAPSSLKSRVLRGGSARLQCRVGRAALAFEAGVLSTSMAAQHFSSQTWRSNNALRFR